ncbi:MAG: hypothetical protein AAF541_08165 [Pseudomonadota bacterium]
MKNNELDDLLHEKFKTLSTSTHEHSIVASVMQRLDTSTQRKAAVGGINREWTLVLGLLFGLGAGMPAFIDLTQWLPSLSGPGGVELPQFAVREWIGSTINSIKTSLSVHGWAAVLASLVTITLLLVPALED